MRAIVDHIPVKLCSLTYDRRDPDALVVRLHGEWKKENRPPAAIEVNERLSTGPKVERVVLNAGGVTGWDSMLLTFLIGIHTLASSKHITIQEEDIPPGVQRLLALSRARPEKPGSRASSSRIPFLESLGGSAGSAWRSLVGMTDLLGGVFLAFLRFLRGSATFRRSDLLLILQQCGAQAVPIVSLISALVGIILAFIASIQLALFGAQIWVASIVGIGMVRALAPIMTAVILAGRTGASFAAQLGTMQVNEEIDALRTFGLSPMEFLVLPRVLALVLMMPLLCLFADLMGILGGLFIGVSMLDLTAVQYCTWTRESIHLADFWVGLASAMVFGLLVALAGCLRGMQCGRSAAAVGEATTSAVVTSIVSIVAAMAVITFVCNVLGV